MKHLFISGFPKCGTTSFANWIYTHPKIAFPSVKECNFFSKDENLSTQAYINKISFENTPEDINSYMKSFKEKSSHNLLFYADGSTSYSYVDSAPKEIFKEFGKNAYVILLVRDPIDALISRYQHSVSRNWEKRDINQIIDEHRKNNNPKTFEENYLDIYKYKKHIEKFYNFLPNLLVVNFNDIVQSPEAVKQQVYNFLEIDHIDGKFRNDNKTVKVNSVIPFFYYKLKKLFIAWGLPEKYFLSTASYIKNKFGVKPDKPQIINTNMDYLLELYREDCEYLKDKWGINFNER